MEAEDILLLFYVEDIENLGNVQFVLINFWARRSGWGEALRVMPMDSFCIILFVIVLYIVAV
jgi:hypothetical protein